MRKNLAVLGASGSIGRQTLEIVRSNPELFGIYSMSVHKDIDFIETAAREFRPKLIAVSDGQAARRLRSRLAGTAFKCNVLEGKNGLEEAVCAPGVDIAVIAVSGIAGLEPTIAAVKCGKRVALANKETLVAAGEIVTRTAIHYGAEIIPVDSEHSAIFQCLQNGSQGVRRLILTASGGPFFGWSREELIGVTPEMALIHPNWSMGKKITIDSATLMNKGLEIIEARWLFDVSYNKIDVVVHRQSIVHSMVEFVDRSILAQMGLPTMRVPIQYALTWPQRIPNGDESKIDLISCENLSFEDPDHTAFPSLRLAASAGEEGGLKPAVLNASNEVAVELFLEKKISFLAIPYLVEKMLEEYPNTTNPDLQEIIETDKAVRRRTAAAAEGIAFN